MLARSCSIATAAAALLLTMLQVAPADEWPLLDGVAQTLARRGLTFEKSAVETAAAASLARAADPGARLMSDAEMAEFQRRREGFRIATGLKLKQNEDGAVIIAELPANGIKGPSAGDLLLSIDGLELQDLDIFRAYATLDGGTNSVTLVSSNAQSGASATSQVERVERPVESLKGIERMPGDILYARLRGLFSADAQRACDALEQALAQDGLLGAVLDLRGAGGDCREAAARMAGLFLGESGNLCSYVELAGGERVALSAPVGLAGRLPLVVLQDEDSSGAAELLAAACRAASSGAVLLGRESAGDPLLRGFEKLGRDANLYLLERRLEIGDRTYDGRAGVQPDIRVAGSARSAWSGAGGGDFYYERKPAEGEELNRRLDQRLGDDAALRRAVEILLGLKALGISRQDGG